MMSGVSGSMSQMSVTFSGPKQSATASTSLPATAGGAMPGQAGAGIGDLQGVAQSNVARGKIYDVAA